MHVEEFKEAYRDAIEVALPDPDSSRYKGVYVLLLRWKGAEKSEEFENLQRVFRDQYHFRTEEYLIDAHEPFVCVHQQVKSFCEKLQKEDVPDPETIRNKRKDPKNEDFLRIIYYAGHSRIGKSGHCFWSRDDKQDSPELDWSNLQHHFRHTDVDTLIFLDCFVPETTWKIDGKGTTEVIAATSMEPPFSATGRYFFTRCLIEVLENLSLVPAFSVAMFQEHMVFKMRSKYGPTYSAIAHKSMRKSIVLKPLSNDSQVLSEESDKKELSKMKVLIVARLQDHWIRQEPRKSLELFAKEWEFLEYGGSIKEVQSE